MKHGIKLLLVIILLWPAAACHDMYSDLLDSRGLGVLIVAPPVLAGLSAQSDSNSILLAPPLLISGWVPASTITAYIGVDGTIQVSGTTVTNASKPAVMNVNEAARGYLFDELTMDETYRIIVVAQNALGASVQQIVKTTYTPTAVAVYGQGGDFTTSVVNNGGISEKSLFWPVSIAINDNGVYIADSRNYRVLYYAGNSTEASLVYGQGGSFSTANNNNGGISASSMSQPYSVAIYAGDVYITDPNNHRLLNFKWDSTTATRVYGQGGDFTTQALNYPSLAESGLYAPYSVTVSASGVYLVDKLNHRVLYYEGTSTTATRVYGQGGSFSTNIENNGGISASSLNDPSGLAIDKNGVYIADSENHRVLYYEGTSTTATRVYGQGGSFNTNTANKGGSVSTATLNNPSGVAVDERGVYIADNLNNRVLHFWGSSTTATGVYGQGGNLSSNAINQGAGSGSPSATSLYQPWGVAVYAGRVYIADMYNNRVLRY